MITIRQATKNLTAIYEESTPELRAQGNAWYLDAHEFCNRLADVHGKLRLDVIGALAVMSPNCSWDINKKALTTLLDTGKRYGNVYPANFDKAESILGGELSPFAAMNRTKRYGHKVRAFFDNIANPMTSQRVTVDTHAIRGAFNSLDITSRHLRWTMESVKGYQTLEQAYINVANEYNLVPNQLQASIWLAVKGAL